MADCLPCMEGHYCWLDGLSEEVLLERYFCPAGTICKEGRDKAPDPSLESDACNPGYYCLSGDQVGFQTRRFFSCTFLILKHVHVLLPQSTTPKGCPIGTYSNITGLTTVSDCTTCPPGYYCNEVGTADPKPCPSGHYCPAGTSNSGTPCPRG